MKRHHTLCSGLNQHLDWVCDRLALYHSALKENNAKWLRRGEFGRYVCRLVVKQSACYRVYCLR